MGGGKGGMSSKAAGFESWPHCWLTYYSLGVSLSENHTNLIRNGMSANCLQQYLRPMAHLMAAFTATTTKATLLFKWKHKKLLFKLANFFFLNFQVIWVGPSPLLPTSSPFANPQPTEVGREGKGQLKQPGSLWSHSGASGGKRVWDAGLLATCLIP